MTRQVTDQLYIDLEYFTPEEYYVYTAEAQVAVTSSATMTCDSERIRDNDSSLNVVATAAIDAVKTVESGSSMSVTATMTATLSNIYGADLFAFSEALLTTAVEVIRDNNVELTSVFDVAVDYIRYRAFAAEEFSLFDIAVQAERSRASSMETQAAFSFDATAEKTTEGIINLASTSTLTASGGSTQKASAALVTTSNLFASKALGSNRPRNLSGATIVTTPTPQYGTGALGVAKATIISTPASNDFIIRENENFVFEVWIYGQAINLDNTQVSCGLSPGELFSNFDSTTNASWAIGTDSQSGARVSVKFRSSTNTVYTLDTNSLDARLTPGVWNLIQFRRINGNTVELLIDGGLYDSISFSGAFKVPTNLSDRKLNFHGQRSAAAGTDLKVFDEINYKIGTSTLETSSAPAKNDWTTQVVLYHFPSGVSDSPDDINNTEIAAASLNSVASISAKLSGPVKAAAAVSSQFSMVTAGGKNQ